MTPIVPKPMSRFVLLTKSQGAFKHSGKYYLLNGRWHKLHADSAAPKGAPVAAHPAAGGSHAPAKHMTDAEWDQLKLPAENVNAGTFNKQIEKLKDLAEGGHVTGILGMQFGTNTYGKKLAIIANHVLGLYGSEHKVAAGQKAGEHGAVSQAPAEPAPEPAPEKPKLGPVGQALKEAIAAPAPDTAQPAPAMPAFVEGKTTTGVVSYYETQAQKILDMGAAGDAQGLVSMMEAGLKPSAKGKVSNTFAGKTANSKLLLQLHADALQQAGGKVDAVMEANPPAAAPEPTAAEKVKQATQAATAAVADEPEFKEAASIASAAVGNSLLSQIPWEAQLLPDSNSNAKSHNGKVAQIKAMAEAGDVAGLEAFKAGKNTYGKKQNLLAQTALAALKENAAAQPVAAEPDAAPAKQTTAEKPKPSETTENWDSLPGANKNMVYEWLSYSAKDKETYSGLSESAEKIWAGLSDAEKAKAKADKKDKKLRLAKIKAQEKADATAAKAAAAGPKDGDTKPGADGNMLVFKNGRWHKSVPTDEHGEMPPTWVPVEDEAKAELSDEEKAQKISAYLTSTEADEHLHAEGKALFAALSPEQQHALNLAAINHQAKAEVAAAAAHPIDAVPMPDLPGLKPAGQQKVQTALTALQELVKMDGAAALKGVNKKMSASGKLIVKLPYGLKLASKIPGSATEQVYNYVEALKAAVGPAKKAPKKAPPTTAAPHADQTTIPSMDDWQQIGPQGGSNPGGKFVDDHGTEWYCKFPSDPDVAKSEVLAAKLYGAIGVAGQDAMLVTKGGKLGIASKWQDVKKVSPAELKKVDGVASGFAADAWLGNWDVVGLEYDNLQVDAATGKAMRVDAGGSLEYRAQGGKKTFGNSVLELDSLRDKAINPQAAAVFGKLTNADITASVAKVLKVSDSQIYALVNTYGPGDAAHKKKLAETLIARKADLLAKYPKAKKEKKHTFHPEKISAPPSFMNWGGSGKDGPSSKSFLNKANEEAVQAIYETAKTGSIDAVKNLSADTFDKNTGDVTGSAPVLDHPSQHVKGYAQQTINEINYQLNPPKRFRFEGGHPLESLHAAYPSHVGGAHSDTVEKAGKFLVLGEPGKVSLDSLALPKITHASGMLTKATYSPAAQSAINAMPKTQQQAIKSYTGSSYTAMNSSLWSGNPSGAAKSAGEALKTMGHEIKPGTVLSRKLSVSGSALDQILKSTGKVLQEPAIMSTSIRPSSWSGNVQLKMHVGPGVKGLWVGHGSIAGGGALSLNAGEDELVLPPNTRLLILSVKKSTGADADGFGASGIQHVIEAVVLPTQQAH